jgi:predicted transcriptional regulator of viral defense system
MRDFMSRSGSQGVTVTMIMNAPARVERSTVRRWLAEDIKRGVVERVTPGFYRMRQRRDAGSQRRGPRGGLAHPEHLEAA